MNHKSKRLYINVWNECHLHCSHCFNAGGKTRGKVLSAAEIIRVIDEARQYLGIGEVQLTGGEPTQRPDLFPIIRQILKKEIRVLLQTNGLFNETIINQILSLSADNFQMIVSLDGMETNDYFRGNGTTEKVIKNLKILSRKFQIRINTLLSSKIKWDEIKRIVQMAADYGLSLAFNPVCPAGKAEQSLLMPSREYFAWMYRLEDFRRQGIRLRKCFNIVNEQLVENEDCPVRKGEAIHIAADGETYPCGFLNYSGLSFGSVINDAMHILSEKGKQMSITQAEACRCCDFYKKGFCHAGCPARIFALYKRFDMVDVYCMAKYYDQSGVQ